MKYTIIFKGKQEANLKKLANELETSHADIIRRSIKLLGLLLGEMDSPDKRLCIVGKDGTIVKELVVLF